MKILGNLMIFENNKPAYPSIYNVKITTSVKNEEHKNGLSLFKHLKNKFLNEKQVIVLATY